MGGVRLRHPDPAMAGVMYVVELNVEWANRRPRLCPRCSRPDKRVFHDRKSVHLRLRPDGSVVVSHEVLAQLATVAMAGLVVENEVARPEPEVLGAVASPTLEIVSRPLNLAQASRHISPGKTKYEARDLMQAELSRALIRR